MEQLVPMSTSVSLALIDSSPPKMAAKVKSARRSFLFARCVANETKRWAYINVGNAPATHTQQRARARWKLESKPFTTVQLFFYLICGYFLIATKFITMANHTIFITAVD